MNGLRGTLIAVSISDAPDRARLGFPQSEIDRVLFSVCTSLVRNGARVLYGGNLDPDGYTFKIFRHLAGAYGTHRDEPPFIHLVPDVVLKSTSPDDFQQRLRESAGIVESSMLNHNGELVPASLDIPLDTNPQRSLTRMRIVSAQLTQGRVVMGGKMGTSNPPSDRYMGTWPGIVEEAFATISAQKPIAVLGAFGGAARDLAIAMGLMPETSRVPRGPQQNGYDECINEVGGLWGKLANERFLNVQQRIANEENADALANLTTRFLVSALQDNELGTPPSPLRQA